MKLFAKRTELQRKKSGRLWRWGWKISLLGIVGGGALSIFVFYWGWAQTFDMKKVGQMPERNTVFDVDGKIYSRLAGANRLIVSLNEVSPAFIDALLAREDTRFFQHNGIDFYGVGRALMRDIMSGSAREGASSLTQQLARNSLPLGGRTLSRKLLEAMVAMRIEHEFTKQQILELYINRIYFGAGCYGVETASQAYFGKNASKLDLSEAAVLAGLIRSPNRFSPLKNPEGAALQRDAVLDRMVELKKISTVQARAGEIVAHQSPSEKDAADSGKLCDGCGATRSQRPSHAGSDRPGRSLHLHHARLGRAKWRNGGARVHVSENRTPVEFSSSDQGQLQAAGRMARIVRCRIWKAR